MVVFALEIYRKKDGSGGVIFIKHHPTKAVIGIPLGDAENDIEISKRAINYLESIKLDLNKIIEIIQSHIDTDCEKIPIIKTK